MDRISALRNVEETLTEFENGEIELATAERQVRNILRTYATSFDADQKTVYSVEVTNRTNDVVVVASSPGDARDNAVSLTDEDVVAVHRVEQS